MKRTRRNTAYRKKRIDQIHKDNKTKRGSERRKQTHAQGTYKTSRKAINKYCKKYT